ncbi:MAG: nitrilase-related carbon-nitrogen hydrolase [Rikenellaceae bacterium]
MKLKINRSVKLHNPFRQYSLLALSLILSAHVALSQPIRVALVQSELSWGNIDKNISTFEAKIEQIDSCDLIILPELFTSGCDMGKRSKELKDGDKRRIAAEYHMVVKRMQMWAKESGAVVVGSTIYEYLGRFYNRLLAVYPTGEYIHYDKHNCFKMGSFTPGEDHVVIDVKGFRFATYICYDLRFSEWARNDGRYDGAIYIANWTSSKAEDWSALLSERAEENNAYVIGVNCVGIDNGGINYMGDSSIYAPSGKLIDRCATDEEAILIVQL